MRVQTVCHSRMIFLKERSDWDHKKHAKMPSMHRVNDFFISSDKTFHFSFPLRHYNKICNNNAHLYTVHKYLAAKCSDSLVKHLLKI